MSTFLMNAKKFYRDFYDKDTWSDELANRTLVYLKDRNKRKECIRETYKLILEDETISESIKLWVRKNYSLVDTAISCGVTTSVVRNNVFYINKTLGRDLSYKNESILSYCIKHKNIDKNDWENISRILQMTITKRKSKVEKIGKLLDSRSLLINIPRKEYHTTIDESEFNLFLRLIQPYFINERKRVQQEINERYLESAGYLNYIMTPGVELSNTDKRRLEKVKSLLDNKTLKDYKKLSRNKVPNLLNVKEEPETVDTRPVEYKTRRIQYDCN